MEKIKWVTVRCTIAIGTYIFTTEFERIVQFNNIYVRLGMLFPFVHLFDCSVQHKLFSKMILETLVKIAHRIKRLLRSFINACTRSKTIFVHDDVHPRLYSIEKKKKNYWLQNKWTLKCFFFPAWQSFASHLQIDSTLQDNPMAGQTFVKQA